MLGNWSAAFYGLKAAIYPGEILQMNAELVEKNGYL